MNTQEVAKLLSIGLDITGTRRMKKGQINVRDLQPRKDVKGGGGHKSNFPKGPPNMPQGPPTRPTPNPIGPSW